MRSSARSSTVLLLALAGACGSPPATTTDAGPADTGETPDAGPLVPHWSSGPDFPYPVAFGTAMVLPGGDGFAYLYVMGGGSGTYPGLGPFHAEVQRSQIQSDGSLGPWTEAGAISGGHGDYPVAGHGAIRLVAEDGAIGFGIAGGGGPSGYLGLVLAGYVQTVDQSIGQWGAFMPMVSATQGGEVFGTFDRFEAHQLALVGGMQGTTATDRVIIAGIMAGAMSPVWVDGPPLPAPRFGHGSIAHGDDPQDIFLIGGAGSDGLPMRDILVSVRDPSTTDVTAWATAGTLASAMVFPQTALLGDHVYVMGGVEGDPGIGSLSSRVRVATVSAGVSGGHGTIAAFSPVPGADLPDGRAAGCVAVLGNTVYIVGGMMGTDHAASSSVVWAQLEP